MGREGVSRLHPRSGRMFPSPCRIFSGGRGRTGVEAEPLLPARQSPPFRATLGLLMNLEHHLPPDLRGPTTTISPIAGGLSGAGVHRVEAAGQSFVLKVAGESESAADWHDTLRIQRLAAD